MGLIDTAPFIFSIYMIIIQNLAKIYDLNYQMAAMPIYCKNNLNDFFFRSTGPIWLLFCMKHIGHLPI